MKYQYFQMGGKLIHNSFAVLEMFSPVQETIVIVQMDWTVQYMRVGFIGMVIYLIFLRNS